MVFLLAFVATGLAQPTERSPSKVKLGVFLRPSVTQTWRKDFGFNAGFFENQPAFSFGGQVGLLADLNPHFRFFSGLGYYYFVQKVNFNPTEFLVNDPTDPVYQTLLKNGSWNSYWYTHYLELPVRLEYLSNVSGSGLVVGLGLTPSYWLAGTYQNEAPFSSKSKRVAVAPQNRLYLGTEVQVGWVWKLSPGLKADSRLFAFVDPFRFKGTQTNRMAFGLQLGFIFGGPKPKE